MMMDSRDIAELFELQNILADTINSSAPAHTNADLLAALLDWKHSDHAEYLATAPEPPARPTKPARPTRGRAKTRQATTVPPEPTPDPSDDEDF